MRTFGHAIAVLREVVAAGEVPTEMRKGVSLQLRRRAGLRAKTFVPTATTPAADLRYGAPDASVGGWRSQRPARRRAAVLDIGCGSGVPSPRPAQRLAVTAVDISPGRSSAPAELCHARRSFIGDIMSLHSAGELRPV